MAEENQARVYGMADQANLHPPAAQGMRGEKATVAESRDENFSHTVTLDSGRTIEVSEGNGVAYAEASGKVAKPEPQVLKVEWVPEPERAPEISKPLLLGALLAAAGVALYAADRWLRERTDGQSSARHPHEGGDPELDTLESGAAGFQLSRE